MFEITSQLEDALTQLDVKTKELALKSSKTHESSTMTDTDDFVPSTPNSDKTRAPHESPATSLGIITSNSRDSMSPHSAKEQLEAISISNQVLRSSNASLEAKLDNTVQELSALQQALEDKIKEHKELCESTTELRMTIASLSESKETAIQSLESSLTSLQYELDESKQTLAQKQKELVAECDSSKTVVEGLKAELERTVEKRDDLQRRTEELKDCIDCQKAEILEIIYENRKLLDQVEKCSEELQKKSELLEDIQHMARHTAEELKSVQCDLKQKDSDFEARERAVEEKYQASVAEYKCANKNLQNDLRLVYKQHQEELKVLREQYQAEQYETKYARLVHENETLKKQADAIGDIEHLSSSCDTLQISIAKTLSENVTVFEEYFNAINDRCSSLENEINELKEVNHLLVNENECLKERAKTADEAAVYMELLEQSNKIEQLNAIVSEVCKSRDSLKEECKRLNEELIQHAVKDCMDHIISSVCDDKVDDISSSGSPTSHLEKENLELQETIEKMMSYQFELEQENCELKAGRKSLPDETSAEDMESALKIAQLHKALDALKRKYEEDIAFAEDERQMNAEMIKELEEDAKANSEESKALTAELKEIQDNYYSEIKDKNEKLEQAEDSLVEMREKFSQFKEEQEDLNKQEFETLQSTLEHEQQQVVALKEEVKALTCSLNECRLSMKQMQQDAEARCSKTNQMLKDSQKLYKTLKGHYDIQKRALKDSETSLENTKATLKKAMQALENIEGEYENEKTPKEKELEIQVQELRQRLSLAEANSAQPAPGEIPSKDAPEHEE